MSKKNRLNKSHKSFQTNEISLIFRESNEERGELIINLQKKILLGNDFNTEKRRIDDTKIRVMDEI